MMRFFISGTGTGVGKTVFSGLLARDFAVSGKRVAYLKPVQTGHPPDDDAAEVRKLSGLSQDQASLLYAAPKPLAPSLAFDIFPFAEAVTRINAVTGVDVLIVEGAGGLLSPLGQGKFAVDFAASCDLRVILVVPNRLGSLSEALLGHAYLTHGRFCFHGFAVNDHLAPDPGFAALNKRELARLLPGKIRYVFDDRHISRLM